LLAPRAGAEFLISATVLADVEERLELRYASEMKFNELRALAHNIADSVASGIGLMVGVYEMDVFADARRSPAGFVEVDFLSGRVTSGNASPVLARAVELYGRALPRLCAKHATTPESFRELSASYHAVECRFLVTVEDRTGRRTTDEYEGVPGRRLRRLDALGRVRTDRRALKRSAAARAETLQPPESLLASSPDK
jgi:hypothetical protein